MTTPIKTLDDLRTLLQDALQVEHSTIPPYFTAWLSIQPGTNQEACGVLRSVMLEEMLHMAQVANVLNAIGGVPSLTSPGFVPVYPATLPHSSDKFKISIESFSKKALQTFLKIERPEPRGTKPKGEGFQTLGQFYAEILKGIDSLCRRLGEKKVFCGDPKRQVTPENYYGLGNLVVVHDRASARAGIMEVVEQGEGSDGKVFDRDPNVRGKGQEPAHYYRFVEVLKGRCFVKGDTARTGPRGPKFPVNFDQVYAIEPNASPDAYPEGSPIRAALEGFEQAYGQLLAAIEDGFNGKQARLNDAMGAMFALENQGRALLRIPSGKPGLNVGLSFTQKGGARASVSTAEEADIDRTIGAHLDELKKPGVLTVRPGWKIKDGWIRPERAVVVTVEKKLDSVAKSARIPEKVGKYPTDVRQASPQILARFQRPDAYRRIQTEGPPEVQEPVFAHTREIRPAASPLIEPDAAKSKSKPVIPYTPAPGATLDAVTAKMSLLCQVSPDAGWPALRDFLNGVKKQLTVGMYDFTSAHILQALLGDMKGSQGLSLVLDHPVVNPTANQTDEETVKLITAELKKRLRFAWAMTAGDPFVTSRIFPTSYHIKVAVRDHKAFWLSSGNWNNSNQPDVDPFAGTTPAMNAILRDSDRDWHVIVEHPGLSKTFEAYLQHDREVAAKFQDNDALSDAKRIAFVEPKGEARLAKKFFPPKRFNKVKVRIQPVLTPDQGAGNYAANFLALIKSAKEKLYVQTQYLHPPSPSLASAAAFHAIVDAVAARVAAGIDVRLIFSQWETEQYLEKVQSAGIPGKVIKIQQGVHNKGIIVDSSVVALGSQNWSTDGVLSNRDASLIIFDARVAQYYEQVFLYDWENMAVQKVPKFEQPAVAATAASAG